jgi:PAS domain-containing protein
VDAGRDERHDGANATDAAAAWYRDLFEGLPTATLVTTPGGLITHANVAACLLLRRPLAVVTGKPFASFVHADGRHAFERMLARARQTAHVEEFALWVDPAGEAPRECRAWVRTHVTLGDGAVVMWTLASLLPDF